MVLALVPVWFSMCIMLSFLIHPMPLRSLKWSLFFKWAHAVNLKIVGMHPLLAFLLFYCGNNNLLILSGQVLNFAIFWTFYFQWNWVAMVDRLLCSCCHWTKEDLECWWRSPSICCDGRQYLQCVDLLSIRVFTRGWLRSVFFWIDASLCSCSGCSL